jgi:rfaE bifunctional protein nucleotidyltransferase chain/domain
MSTVYSDGVKKQVWFRSGFPPRQPRAFLRLPSGKRLPHHPCAMQFREKIIPQANVAAWRQIQRAAGRKVVATNGCFDVLHVGHVSYLAEARRLGDLLIVGLTNDAAVRELKGPGRPVNSEADRALMLAALQSVDTVCLFAERDARRFLEAAAPDVYVKGGDYTLDTINQDERRFLERIGCRIALLPAVPGKSTTALLERISRL